MKVYLLIDRSGSMSSRWEETINSVNSYVAALGKRTKVHVAVFDSGTDGKVDYQVVRDTTASKFTPIEKDEFAPRGYTPLYDATNILLVKALADNNKRQAIVIVTDGGENNSREVSLNDVKAKLAEVEKKNWEVVYLGVDFKEVDAVAGSLGLAATKSYTVSSKNIDNEMTMLAGRSMAYAASGTRIDFTDEDRTRAVTESE